ncbi:MFS transporter [Legionella feeleii]|uniref:Proline/betaine transporter n=1 Tax=Legionella feeleii TaxID=453 RepID=A0A378IWH6_9GAMM|nr:MFS transporter [Legionella feeleii]STX39272.1 proline/betaine transporter [Legionella feeleii]
MRNVSLTSAFLGTLVEVYDFTVFPILIPILSEVFFPTHVKNSAINFTILAYVVSYFIKPFGAIGFGYLIDRYGRKKILLYTTLLMTIATSAIGLLPPYIMGTYYGAGLIACRIIQGLSISGEFSSAIIIAVEQGNKYPAFSGSLAFIGGSVGLLLANLSVVTLLYLMPHEQIIQYAWRIPFLIGASGCFILLLLRNKIDDSAPGMASASSSFSTLIISHKKELIETFIVSSLSASAFYVTFIFMPTFLSSLLKLHSHQQSILITLTALLIYLTFLPFGGMLADKIGIKRQIKIASLLYLIFSYMVFDAISQLTSINCTMVLIFFAIIQALLNSALPAFIVAQFQPNQRGQALAISYNISLTLFAGLMPYLILSTGNQLNPGIPISICAALSLLFINFKGKKYGYLRSKPSY